VRSKNPFGYCGNCASNGTVLWLSNQGNDKLQNPALNNNVELCDLHISLYQEYRSRMDTVDYDASDDTLSACYLHYKVQSTNCQQVSLQTFVSTELLED
jgi:hypothetical protein